MDNNDDFLPELDDNDIQGAPDESPPSQGSPSLSGSLQHLNTPRCESSHVTDLIFNPTFKSQIGELNLSLEFIQLIRSAKLNSSGLSKEQIHQLCNPPQCIPNLLNEQEEWSLETFIDTLNAPDETYWNIQKRHNSRFPDRQLLSLDQLKIRLATWSGIEPLEHDMCPESCMAYTGPFAELQFCRYCGMSRWDQYKLEVSNGKTKVAARQYYTFPLGPQVQALYQNPENAEKLKYR